MKYRAEIDGLRAIAVVPVILFHAGFEVFSGGYVGVDIFFVISGYLITTIIVDELDRGDFSIARFYERRARRILPALLLVVAASFPFAWAWLTPGDMQDFAISVVGVATFSSNFVFWEQSGYFDTAAEFKPMLHTWSLAVEEQFYILFPIFLGLIWRFGKRLLVPLLMFFFLMSLLLAQWAVAREPDAAFFLLLTRGWELMIGSFCALALRRPRRAFDGLGANIASLAGLLLIMLAVFTFDKATPTPSLITLVPTVGSALLILASNKGTLTHWLLGARPMVAIGLVSYSAYLWHQPILAFYRLRFGAELGLIAVLGCVALTFLLAVLSWRFVEQPFRRGIRVGTGPLLSMSFGALTVTAVIGYAVYASNGIPNRFDPKFLQIVAQEDNVSKTYDVLGRPNVTPSIALIGDSHANAIQDALHASLDNAGLSASVLTTNGCPPSFNLWRHDLPYEDACDLYYSEVIETLKAKPTITSVIVSARFALYLNATRFDNQQGGVEVGKTAEVIYDDAMHKDTIRPIEQRAVAVEDGIVAFFDALSELGIATYVFTSVPEVGWDVPQIAMWRHRAGDTGEVTTRRDVYDQRVAVTERLHTRLRALSGVTLIDASQPFCNERVCYATEDGIPLYYDTNHLTRGGARRLVDYFLSDVGFLD